VDFPTFVKRVGARVRRARWAEGLTQEQVAAEVLTFRLLAELERGHGNPTLQTLFKLAQRLRLSVSDLVDAGDGPRGAVPLAERVAVAPKPGRKAKPRRLAKGR
jgi:transcriptional regulator with XRE-family HTH domain